MSESKTIDDGGPAFPHDEFTKDGNHYKVHPGISVLDWFAGQALAGLVHSSPDSGCKETAADAYLYAVHMLKERERLNAKPSE